MINGTNNPKACVNNDSFDMVIENGYILGMEMCFSTSFKLQKAFETLNMVKLCYHIVQKG